MNVNLLLALSEAHHAEESSSIWDSYLDLITDPAHLMLEATLILVIDVLIGLLLWPAVKRWVRRHDRIHHGHVCDE